MKHPATREVYEYWNRQRAGAAAPERSAFDPAAIRHLIGDMFVIGCDEPSRLALRVAGTRICAMLGRDVKGEDFCGLFARASRRKVEDFVAIATEESLATLAGVTASTGSGVAVHLELLLLPFASSVLAPQSVTGLLVTLGAPATLEQSPLRDFSLVTWRHAGHPTLRQRTVRRLAIARGFMGYEGFRD